MTPDELIDMAKKLNPEKFGINYAEALMDAYAYMEAVKQTEHSRAIGGIYVIEDEVERKQNIRYKRKHIQRKEKDLLAELKQLLKKRKMSHRKAGERLGVSGSTVSAWLSSKWKPNKETMIKLALLIEELKVIVE